ncbi:MAG: hypothetical protein HQM00_02265 [Magnetococcales bacterium]|nr:hypothetical protein [Magnetococcales bacterium]
MAAITVSGSDGLVWTQQSGYLASNKISRKLRTETPKLARFRQFCDVQEAIGYGGGDTFHWDLHGNLKKKGGKLREGTPIPETSFDTAQGTLVIDEYGNSVPFTKKLETLSEIPIMEVVNKTLKKDCAEALDREAHAQFSTTPMRMTAGTSTSTVTLTTNGTAAETNNVPMGKGHVKLIVETMKTNSVPTHDNGDFYAIGSFFAFRQLKSDLEAVHQYTESGAQLIMRGEEGRYEGCRFVGQNNIAAGVGSTADVAWTNAKSDAVFFLGADTVTEAIAVQEEIRVKIPGDYGRDRGVAWFAMVGYALARPLASQARVYMWDSLT